MAEPYKGHDLSKEGNPDKNFIQRYLYKNANIRGNALVVSGPEIERHIIDFRNFISHPGSVSKLTIVDNNLKIYRNILSKLNDLNLGLNIDVQYSDIQSILKYPKFVDADLTGSLRKMLPVFKYIYEKMDRSHGALICTYCRRSDPRFDGPTKDMIEVLNLITQSVWCRKYESEDQLPPFNMGIGVTNVKTTYISGNLTSIAIAYKIKGSTPMTSFLIKW